MWQKYFLVFKSSVLDALEYRLDFFLHTFKYAFTISLMAGVWLAVAREKTLVGFSNQEIIIYYLTAAVIYNASNFHPEYVEADIKQGFITKLLIKPVSAFWYYFSHQSASLCIETLFKLAVFLAVIPLLQISFTPHHVWLVLLYFPMIFLFCFSLFFCIATFTFWFHDVWSFRFCVMFMTRMLSGMLIPLVFFPVWYQSVSFYLPFQHLAFTPIQILLNKINITQGLQGLGILGLWTLGMFLVQKLVWHKASQSYEGTGI
jgi:ABC-2 type transport system permease protein